MLKYFQFRQESCTSGCVQLNLSHSLNTYQDYFNSLDDESQSTFDLIARKYNFDKKITFISNKKNRWKIQCSIFDIYLCFSSFI